MKCNLSTEIMLLLTKFSIEHTTVCPRSLDPIYMVSYLKKNYISLSTQGRVSLNDRQMICIQTDKVVHRNSFKTPNVSLHMAEANGMYCIQTYMVVYTNSCKINTVALHFMGF